MKFKVIAIKEGSDEHKWTSEGCFKLSYKTYQRLQ